MKNKTLIFLGKKALKELLAECTEEQFLFFKRMYCHNHLDWNIGDAVDQMDTTKIDNAITQVERTIEKKLKLKS